jgi:hypothetical protein
MEQNPWPRMNINLSNPLQEQTERWRDAVFTRPTIEGVYPVPGISLPPDGEDF